MKIFEALRSDAVLAEGALASDVGSLWRRLSRTPAVQDVAQALFSDPGRIRSLCDYVDDLLAEPHNETYRHPNDIAVCAALVILDSSPLAQARSLFHRLGRLTLPSLVWVRRMADYCQEHYVPTSCSGVMLAQNGVTPLADDSARPAADVTWSDAEMGARRHEMLVSV